MTILLGALAERCREVLPNVYLPLVLSPNTFTTSLNGRIEHFDIVAPLAKIEMNVAGLFSMTTSNNKYILVDMNYFSKWPEVSY